VQQGHGEKGIQEDVVDLGLHRGGSIYNMVGVEKGAIQGARRPSCQGSPMLTATLSQPLKGAKERRLANLKSHV
jgi:hypothetical protein